MAIGFGAAGTVAHNTTEPQTVTVPAVTAGNMHILVTCMKATTIPTIVSVSGGTGTWTAPADSTAVSTGPGSQGVDSGPVRVALYWKEAVAGDGSVSVDLSAAPNPCFSCILSFTKGAGETWEAPICGTAIDDTGSTTSYDPPASGTTIGLGSGDWLGSFDGINGDAGTPTLPGTLTATGITFGSLVNRLNDGATTGQDMRIIVDTAPYSSGTATAGPDRSISYSAANANMGGISVFFRLRVTVADTRPMQRRAPRYGWAVPGRASYGR